MERIIAATFDIADQKCKTYNALEWHNFIADTREANPECAHLDLDSLMEVVYGDEFWFEVNTETKLAYQVAFDLRSEEFIVCDSDTEVEFVMEMAADAGDEDEIFWAE